MIPTLLHDRTTIETFLRQDPYLHIYELGDLDDFFWPYTTWFAGQNEGQVRALFLMYSGADLPVILAIAREGQLEPMRELLRLSARLLPRRFYAHLSPGLGGALSDEYHLESHGRYLKMGLTDPSRLGGIDPGEVIQFTPADVNELRAFYNSAYPGNWFDPRMLETGCYYGIRRAGAIVSVAGIHVYSPRYRAAALGNITTHPAYRGQGLGQRVTARLCQELLKTTDIIGLNVSEGNAPALAVYNRLGFTPVAEYDEYMVSAEGPAHASTS